VVGKKAQDLSWAFLCPGRARDVGVGVFSV
jgi:hypothetical protein